MRVASIHGWSGSGKTTLIAGMISALVSRGERVASVKHTHHPLNADDRGDTALFRAAGAEPVVLAGESEAVFFSAAGTRRVTTGSAAEIVSMIASEMIPDIVLIEGFGDAGDWPRIRLQAGQWREPREVIAFLDASWNG